MLQKKITEPVAVPLDSAPELGRHVPTLMEVINANVGQASTERIVVKVTWCEQIKLVTLLP